MLTGYRRPRVDIQFVYCNQCLWRVLATVRNGSFSQLFRIVPLKVSTWRLVACDQTGGWSELLLTKQDFQKMGYSMQLFRIRGNWSDVTTVFQGHVKCFVGERLCSYKLSMNKAQHTFQCDVINKSSQKNACSSFIWFILGETVISCISMRWKKGRGFIIYQGIWTSTSFKKMLCLGLSGDSTLFSWKENDGLLIFPGTWNLPGSLQNQSKFTNIVSILKLYEDSSPLI